MQALIIPFIVFAGAAQALASPMGAQLRNALSNVWLASVVVFAINTAFFAALFAVRPLPLPTMQGIASMPWWAPLSGLIGGIAGFAGLMFVDKIGAGALNGILLTANIVASIAIDHYGFLGTPVHPVNIARAAGAVLMVGGILLVSRY